MQFGIRFASLLTEGSVVALYGDLGSGKTTCIRGLCRGLGVEQVVTSPTFTLINEYRGRLPVYHFDFYRLESPEELWDLGLEEYFYGDGVCFIEWPEIVRDLLPADRIEIHLAARFEPGWEQKREIRVLSPFRMTVEAF